MYHCFKTCNGHLSEIRHVCTHVHTHTLTHTHTQHLHTHSTHTHTHTQTTHTHHPIQPLPPPTHTPVQGRASQSWSGHCSRFSGSWARTARERTWTAPRPRSFPRTQLSLHGRHTV